MTPKQHGFELCGSTHARILFNKCSQLSVSTVPHAWIQPARDRVLCLPSRLLSSLDLVSTAGPGANSLQIPRDDCIFSGVTGLGDLPQLENAEEKGNFTGLPSEINKSHRGHFSLGESWGVLVGS